MDVILIPGLWLDASSWDEVTPALAAAGHRAHPVTLPGLESEQADRSGITLQTHIDHVTSLVDSIDGPLALVAHSGGGLVAHGAVDARPTRVSRVVYVDSGPGAEGTMVNDEIPHDDTDMPFPGWAEFEGPELADFSERLREEVAGRTVTSPSHAAIDPLHVHDDRRYEVPVTVITTSFPRDELEQLIGDRDPAIGDLARIASVEIVDLPTSHWPQFTRPDELAALIVDALES